VVDGPLVDLAQAVHARSVGDRDTGCRGRVELKRGADSSSIWCCVLSAVPLAAAAVRAAGRGSLPFYHVFLVSVRFARRTRHAKCGFAMLGVNRVTMATGVTPEPNVTPWPY